MVAYRNLGSSGLRVTEITYGNWLTHGSQVEADTAIECVRTALDLGITSFDTADVYANTRAEEVLGRALKGERRDGLEIFTKVYFPVDAKGANDSGLSRKHILRGVEGSLRRLGTDYVDLLQAHRFDDSTPLEETISAFADVVRSGKALYVGVSEWTAPQLRAGQVLATQMGFRLVSNQPQYSMLWRVIEAEVVPTAAELGMGLMPYFALAAGFLTGKYRRDEAISGDRAGMVADYQRPECYDVVETVASVAADHGVEPAAVALAWLRDRPGVTAPLASARNLSQLRPIVEALTLEVSDEETRALTRVSDAARF